MFLLTKTLCITLIYLVNTNNNNKQDDSELDTRCESKSNFQVRDLKKGAGKLSKRSRYIILFFLYID